MKIFYNSSTGNSLYVAKRIKEKFNDCELVSIPKAIKDEKYECSDEIIGFIYPIHYAGLPIVVYNFLSQIKIKENSYIFVIGVSGGGGANTSFNQVQTLLGEKNKVNNFCTIKYISNYLRAGREPSEKRALIALRNNEEKIDEFIESIKNKEIVDKKYRYGIGNIKYNLAVSMIRKRDNDFNVNDNCINCKMCQKSCPVDNIIFENNKPKWYKKCVDCMACINICPKNAINIGKRTINKNRYLNPYIERNELL